jgi:hypothetical protein
MTLPQRSYTQVVCVIGSCLHGRNYVINHHSQDDQVNTTM